MKKETYKKIIDRVKKSPNGTKMVIAVNKLLTNMVYVAYFILLMHLLFNRDARVVRIILTTAISFVIVSIFRKTINMKRPYEVFEISPIIPKDKKGNSFPSRHVFSVFVIAMAYFYISVPMSIVVFMIGVAIAVFRVIGGVHFPRDVIAGAIIGVVFGVLGFYII